MKITRVPRISRFDRLVAMVAPRYGMRRIAARSAMQFIGYSRGGYDAGNSLAKDLQYWNPSVDSAVTDLHPSAWQLRARSRELVRNAPLAGGALDLAVRSVVGEGLKAEPAVDAEILGLTEKQAEDWGKQASRLFEAWSDPEGGACISRKYAFSELQALVFRGMFEGGDTLVLNRYMPERGAPFGSCLHLIEAERVSNPNGDMDTQEIAGGVEVDPDTGMVRAYHVADQHPGEAHSLATGWRRIGAWTAGGVRYARLVSRPRRIGERRGEPWLATGIRSMKHLERYTLSELVGAELMSMFTAFVYQEDPRSDPLSNITRDWAPSEGETALAEAIGVRPEATDKPMRPGMINYLGKGEKIEFPDMRRPNSQFTAFVQTIWQHIGIALGIPYEVLTMRFASSYSASKGALSEAWKTFRVARALLVLQLCQPAYNLFIGECVERGLLDAPGFFDDIVMRRAWSRVRWMGTAPASIDPLKEAQAAGVRVRQGFSTIDRETRELLGTNLAENEAQLRREHALMQELRPGLYEADEQSGTQGENADNSGGGNEED